MKLIPVLLFTLIKSITSFEEILADDVDHLPLRYDYKQSFKKPYLVNQELPGFDKVEGALYTDNFIRLSSSIPGSRGSIWAQEANQYQDWVVEYSFQITGRNPQGKDGLAFWYTKERLENGPILGNRDQWNGLAIMADTYDKVKQMVSPYFIGILNEGDIKIGDANNIMTHMFGGCFREFRNSLHPVHVRVTYVEKVLKVAVDTLQKGKSFTKCFEKHDVNLPTGYYFGFSASSSHPADDHDIFDFAVYQAYPEKPEHDMDRPYEQEMIEKLGKFGINEKLRKKMQDLKKKINTLQVEEGQIEQEEDTFIKETSIQQTQFNILESLNSLHSKITEIESKLGSNNVNNNNNNVPPTNNHHVNEKLEHELKMIKNRMDDLDHNQKGLVELVQNLYQDKNQISNEVLSLKNNLNNLDFKLDKVLHSTDSNHSTLSSMLNDVYAFLKYGLYIAAFIAIILGLIALFKKQLFSNDKKYI